MNQNRRLAAIFGGSVAAVAGATILLRPSSHDAFVSSVVGLICGVLATVGIGLLAKRWITKNQE